MSQEESTNSPWAQIHWGRLILAGALAAVAFSLTDTLLGGDPFAYGAVLLPDADPAVQNAVGALTVLLSCLLYALIWVVFFIPVSPWSVVIKAIMFTLVASFASILVMPGAAAIGFVSGWRRFADFLAVAVVLILVYRPKGGAA